ncbi:MAG: ROK family protein, partial [Octadecabacter sp.]
MISGGIDLGGTKIEARLFDADGHATLATRRVPTPTESYGAFLDALQAQIEWLMEQADAPDLPIGIAVPGLLDPETGRLFAANIVASGQLVGADISARLGRDIPLLNDCMAFALSEACGGAGDGFGNVLGLILGTGVGAGFCTDGRMPMRAGGLAVEIGHVAAPAS